MQNKIKIKNLTDVITGYTFRSAIKEDSASSLYVLQAKNIKDDLILDDSLLVSSTFDTSHTKAFAMSGDIAISTRGFFRSAVVRSNKRIIASSSVYLLRLKEGLNILAEYIVIYLNSSIGQQDIGQLVTGAAIKLILRKDLENIKIPLVSIEEQHKLVFLYRNVKEQGKLMERKKEIQKNIINGIFKKIVSK